MKRLNPISDEVLEKHHAFYSSGIQHALERLAAGQRVEFAESEEDEKIALKEQEVLGDSGVRQYFQSIRDLFVKNSLLKATAIKLRRIVSTQIPSFSSTKPKKSVNDILSKVFDYSQFVAGRALDYRNGKFVWRKNTPAWGAYEYVQYHIESVRFCPYCNADALYAFNKQEKSNSVKSALDHFFPKGKYPFLALSLYNLIPACFRCNSQMKGSNDAIGLANPYIEDIHRNVVFFPLFEKPSSSFAGPCRMKVLPRKQWNPMAKKYVRLFEVESLYSTSFSEEIRQCVTKARQYSPENRRYLAALLKIDNPQELEKNLFGMPLDESEINKTRLGKMTLDIVERFRN